MRIRLLAALLLSPSLALGGALTPWSENFDPLSTAQELDSFTPKAPRICQWKDYERPLPLADAVDIGLCNHPTLRAAWASVEWAAAEVGRQKSAYLPILTLGGGRIRQQQYQKYSRMSNQYNIDPKEYAKLYNQYADLDHDMRVTTWSLSLQWVLYDFGQRAANLEAARQLLRASGSQQQQELQKAILDIVDAYDAVQTRLSALHAAQNDEQRSISQLDAADARRRVGAGDPYDQVQMRTALRQSQLLRSRAEQTLDQAYGRLAVRLGLSPQTRLQIVVSDLQHNLGPSRETIDALLEQARRYHPELRAGREKLAAAEAEVSATRASGRPTLSLTMGASFDGPVSNGPDEYSNRNRSIGLQLQVPLFDGFSTSYLTRRARARVEEQRARLAQSEEEVALSLWRNYRALHAIEDELTLSESLVEAAQQGFTMASGRYKAGVGSSLELLAAQNDLSRAEHERVIVIANWREVRLALYESLGELSLDRLR